MAVTTPYYKNGPIKYMEGSSGDIDTGGQFLNDNFTQIYDLINPSTASVGVLKQVPAICEGSSSTTKATTFALPSTSGLTAGTPYVAVYDTSGSVTWQPYSSASTGVGGTSTNSSVSELVYPGGSIPNDYYGSGTWFQATSVISSYQKTYKTATIGSTFSVELPDFGSWVITGTLLFALDEQDSADYNFANLVRVWIYGRLTPVLRNNNTVWEHKVIKEVYDVCTDSNNTPVWTTNSSYLSASFNNATATLSPSHSGTVSSVFADLSVIGGCKAHETSGFVLVAGSGN